MILEHAQLTTAPGRESEFDEAFAEAPGIVGRLQASGVPVTSDPDSEFMTGRNPK